jgi:hypothetical protein
MVTKSANCRPPVRVCGRITRSAVQRNPSSAQAVRRFRTIAHRDLAARFRDCNPRLIRAALSRGLLTSSQTQDYLTIRNCIPFCRRAAQRKPPSLVTSSGFNSQLSVRGDRLPVDGSPLARSSSSRSMQKHVDGSADTSSPAQPNAPRQCEVNFSESLWVGDRDILWNGPTSSKRIQPSAEPCARPSYPRQ